MEIVNRQNDKQYDWVMHLMIVLLMSLESSD